MKLKSALWAAAAVALILIARYFHGLTLLRTTLAWIQGLGPAAPVAFIALYILASLLLFPASLLTWGAGIIFGVVYGSIYTSIASTLGATAAFLVGRYLVRDWVTHKISGNRIFRAIDDSMASEGWKIVGLTRLSPVFPFVFLNYTFSLTTVSLKDFVLASWIGMMPGTILHVYIGSLAGNLAGLGARHRRSPIEWALYALGLAATVAVTVYITRIARKALNKRISI